MSDTTGPAWPRLSLSDVMKLIAILLLASLLSGWILSLGRRGFLARTLVIVSVPLGAFLGGYSGYTVCRLMIFPMDGTAASQHNWIGWVDAGILGMAVGLVVVPAIALAFTGRMKDERPTVNKSLE